MNCNWYTVSTSWLDSNTAHNKPFTCFLAKVLHFFQENEAAGRQCPWTSCFILSPIDHHVGSVTWYERSRLIGWESHMKQSKDGIPLMCLKNADPGKELIGRGQARCFFVIKQIFAANFSFFCPPPPGQPRWDHISPHPTRIDHYPGGLNEIISILGWK